MHLRSARVLAALVMTFAAFAAVGCGRGDDVPVPQTGSDSVRVVIPRGASVRAAADSLARSGVLRSARLFRWYVSYAGRDRVIKPGTYMLKRGEDWSEILDALVAGRALVVTVTIPEGFDLRDISRTLEKALGVSADSVRAVATDSAWIARLDAGAGSLEGYLFPDTYTFPSGATTREAIVAMLERFVEVWKPEWNERLVAMGITRHEAITMASIVEKEARIDRERPIIAAVYWNRLKKGMKLQADPTVQYALPAHVERVMYKDLEVDSKYNTYRYEGLPPGPIASPGVASIEAAIDPAPVTYLFFVAHPDGHHEFRNTFAEHQRAVEQMRKASRERGK